MKRAFIALLGMALILSASISYAAEDPELGAHAGSQAAADIIMREAKADGAFLAAGLVKTNFNKSDLATLLEYPTDEIVVMNLSGAQIRQAFERSLSLYPQPNTSFLQIAGFEVTFSKNARPNSRVLSVTAQGAKLDETRTYSVAMPSNLARGALGYFKIWDKAKIARTLEGATLESVLRGQSFSESSPRWVAQG